MLMTPGCTPDSGGDTGTASTIETTTGATTSTATGTTSIPTTGEPGTSTSTSASTTVDTSTGEPVAEPFTIAALDQQWITGTGGWDTQHADADIDLGAGEFASVTLIVELESSCFPFEDWETPPPGHNWPAKCDAFDRTMGFIMDPADAPEDPPGFEALRSITPFGTDKHIEADITDWANAHPGVHSLRSYINTWPDGAGKVSGSEGGWTLSVRLEVVPGPAPRKVLAAIPLYLADLGADAPAPQLPFTLPEGTSKSTLAYTVSGHGGANDPSSKCIGPAEEFCKRTHHILVDGVELSSFVPWRPGCSDFCTTAEHTWPDQSKFTYCQENPCGNLQSVNAARANWCPSDVVAPLVGSLKLGAGDYTLGFVVDDMYPGGIWTTSAVVYAYGE